MTFNINYLMITGIDFWGNARRGDRSTPLGDYFYHYLRSIRLVFFSVLPFLKEISRFSITFW